jgi:hypothetical protein
MSMRTILGVFVIAVLVVGCGGTAATQAPAASAVPSASAAVGGTLKFKLDGAPATTTIDATGDRASLSGTAVTTFSAGTHTVRLGCAAQDDGSWVFGGTVEKTTVPGESAGAWSAVIVKAGTPQQIGIWLSGDASEGSDCAAWVASIKPAEIGAENFSPVVSGVVVPPA